ncbi:MAG: hypothetical protein A2X64_10420 [Ignavibacteria bacterium GWF2_33_9]|nr:MAG: hypothetical protein A2X64_10420 [Ignavibacteria bacterium GWF2_33_9]
MPTLSGSSEFVIDNKGRVKLPSRMLKVFSVGANDSIMIIIGINQRIWAYPMEQWEVVEQALKKLNPFNKKHRYFKMRFLKDTEEVTMDAQQRIILPKRLVELTNLKDKVKIVGSDDHIEFWIPEEFDEYMATISDEEYEEMGEEIGAFYLNREDIKSN